MLPLSRDRFAHIPLDEVEVAINAARHRPGPLDFAPVAVEPADRREKISLAQIKGEQPDAAADIEQRLVRVAKQLVGSGKDRVAAQFPAGINAQPAFPETGRDPGAGIFVRGRRTIHFSLRGSAALTK